MRLFQQIGIALVVAAVLPLGSAGFAVVWFNSAALEREVKLRFDQTAAHAALAVSTDFGGRVRLVSQTAQMIDWAKLGGDEIKGALALLRQQSSASVVRYVHEATTLDDVAAGVDAARALREAPVARAVSEGPQAVALAPPSGSGVEANVVAALKLSRGVLLLALPLRDLAGRLEGLRRDEPEVTLFLVDDLGHPMLVSGPRAQPSLAIAEAVRQRHSGATRRVVSSGEVSIAGFATVGGLGWTVIIEEDAAQALAAPRRMRQLTLSATLAVALFAVGLAFLLARRLSGAIERLSLAARALGKGALGTRVAVTGAQELVALGSTFNQMGDELEKSRAEIEGWNRELEARVEQRTAELRQAQAQLVEAQKLAALGQLGAGVAHEINNPLAGVLGHVQLLLSNKQKDDRDYHDLKCIDEAARKASEVVQNLLRFSVQRKEPVRTLVDLNRVAKETLTLTRSLLEEHKIDVVFELATPPPRARADGGQVAQVLLNLLANARTAIAALPAPADEDARRGRITLRTRAAAAPGGMVAVEVEDSGKGIAADVLPRIFEPFFTTKDEWSNVGLGLSVSFRIVEEHGGRIEVKSEPGHGALFTVYLPT